MPRMAPCCLQPAGSGTTPAAPWRQRGMHSRRLRSVRCASVSSSKRPAAHAHHHTHTVTPPDTVTHIAHHSLMHVECNPGATARMPRGDACTCAWRRVHSTQHTCSRAALRSEWPTATAPLCSARQWWLHAGHNPHARTAPWQCCVFPFPVNHRARLCAVRTLNAAIEHARAGGELCRRKDHWLHDGLHPLPK